MNRSILTARRAGLALCLAAASSALLAQSLEPTARKELKRAELSGAPGMQLISSVSEYQPGEEIPRHVHHGLEAVYVVQGAMVQVPGKEPQLLPTGADLLNLRDVPHAGFKVVGDKPLKLFTVHVVDTGKPLYDAAPPAAMK
jgi:quercetin dioxygenase-like cupin family protein